MIVSKDEIFFVWINDNSCLHTTRANYPDPCQKEFDRLKSRHELENFDPAIHHFKFEIRPNKLKPFQCRSLFLNHEVTLNSYLDGNLYIGHAFYCDEPIDKIAYNHVKSFLSALATYLEHSKIDMQIQFIKNGHAREIDLITFSFPPVSGKMSLELEKKLG